MRLVEHDKREDKKVWLDSDEIQQLLDCPDDTEKEIAFSLGARCGLRSHEILNVTPEHVFEDNGQQWLQVPEGKGDKYREAPIHETLASQIRTVGNVRDQPDKPVVTVTSTAALRYWIGHARDQLAEETGDSRWTHVSMHDLRPTWATQLASRDVDPLIVCEWGGWNDLDTFLNHYQGTYDPEAQARERSKVDWL